METAQFLDDNCYAAIIGGKLANLLPLANVLVKRENGLTWLKYVNYKLFIGIACWNKTAIMFYVQRDFIRQIITKYTY